MNSQQSLNLSVSSPPAMMYQLEAVQHAYGSRRVLDVAELVIRWGEIFALVGPSGAGKSTLLRLLNFLESPSAGSLSFAGQRVTEALPLAEKRRVVAVFQKPGLLNRPVSANIVYGLKLRGRNLPPPYSNPGLNGWASSMWPTNLPPNFLPEKHNGWLWPVPWCWNRMCFCWMNPPPTSIHTTWD